jgi:hypothetical protein
MNDNPKFLDQFRDDPAVLLGPVLVILVPVLLVFLASVGG